ncbi:MAG: hypothetical protein AAGA78_18085, partial [Pseudomonadota bacterium]
RTIGKATYQKALSVPNYRVLILNTTGTDCADVLFEALSEDGLIALDASRDIVPTDQLYRQERRAQLQEFLGS